jgi:hypothetical protein
MVVAQLWKLAWEFTEIRDSSLSLQFYCGITFAVASESKLWDIIDNYNSRSINRAYAGVCDVMRA